jgi:hypothetical protein
MVTDTWGSIWPDILIGGTWFVKELWPLPRVPLQYVIVESSLSVRVWFLNICENNICYETFHDCGLIATMGISVSVPLVMISTMLLVLMYTYS